ncbi:MAG: GNAT family N-acetyltransferase [Bauldia sp.]|nr:GNAT family N-acetyltransferase [Bauldia sp.]
MTPRRPDPAIAVRDARREDADIIVRMAGDLSRHDGDPDTHFDRAAAEADLFGPRPWVSGLIAEIGGAVAGMLLWYPSYETAWAARGAFVVSLWVDEPFRRRGVATALVAAAADRTTKIGGEYLWWASKPSNRRAHATYSSLGALAEPVMAHALVMDAFATLARFSAPAEDSST